MLLLPLALLGCPWIPAPETCDQTVYADADGDGLGDADHLGTEGTCPGDGWVTDNDDCDDDDAAVGEIT